MERRQFLTKLGAGSVAAAVSAGDSAGHAASPAQNEHAHPTVPAVFGTLANATVSFGAWESAAEGATPPHNSELDRYPNLSPATRNYNRLTPSTATIQTGGTVNFVISGLHQVVVYAPGKTPEDVNTALVRPTTGTPPGVPLINDPTDRVYAGLDPSTQPRDRVEAVQFPTPGLHLVICGVQAHFVEGMFGYVNVVDKKGA